MQPDDAYLLLIRELLRQGVTSLLEAQQGGITLKLLGVQGCRVTLQIYISQQRTQHRYHTPAGFESYPVSFTLLLEFLL
jgi:hypothetical protein